MLENWLCYCILPLTAGFVLDLILGDPRRIVHPVVLMGKMISGLERILLFREQAKEAEKKVIKRKKKEFYRGMYHGGCGGCGGHSCSGSSGMDLCGFPSRTRNGGLLRAVLADAGGEESEAGKYESVRRFPQR